MFLHKVGLSQKIMERRRPESMSWKSLGIDSRKLLLKSQSLSGPRVIKGRVGRNGDRRFKTEKKKITQ